MESGLSPVRVLIFDSGVGSLSIGAAIRRQLPALDLVYAMDSAGFPYGAWEEAALSQHICAQVQALQLQYCADIIVVACNSASTTVLPALRQTIAVPIVGVVPAIKPAAQHSKTKTIGLLATKGTLSRAYTHKLISDFASDCHVIPVSHPLLAPAIESYLWSGENAPDIWQNCMASFVEDSQFGALDAMVLACTHFPLVQPFLAEGMIASARAKKVDLPEQPIQWIDSGEAIARRVDSLVAELSAAKKIATAKDVRGKNRLHVIGEFRSIDTLERLSKMHFDEVVFSR